MIQKEDSLKKKKNLEPMPEPWRMPRFGTQRGGRRNIRIREVTQTKKEERSRE